VAAAAVGRLAVAAAPGCWSGQASLSAHELAAVVAAAQQLVRGWAVAAAQRLLAVPSYWLVGL
jgi:hypothetical protein